MNVLWRVRIVSDELGYLAEDIYKQSVEGMAWSLLAAYHKMLEERNNLKKESLIRKEPKLDDLENFQPIHSEKNEKAHYIENFKDVVGQLLAQEIMAYDLRIQSTISADTRNREGVIPVEMLPALPEGDRDGVR